MKQSTFNELQTVWQISWLIFSENSKPPPHIKFVNCKVGINKLTYPRFMLIATCYRIVGVRKINQYTGAQLICELIFSFQCFKQIGNI